MTVEAIKTNAVALLNSIKENGLKVVNWLGRQVVYLGSLAKSGLFYIANFIKNGALKIKDLGAKFFGRMPFYFNIVKEKATSAWSKGVEYAKANKSPLAIGTGTGLLIATGLYYGFKAFGSKE